MVKFDGSKDFRDIIDKKEKVILAIGLMFSKYSGTHHGTGSLIAIDVPFFDTDSNKQIGSHKCFFILTCAHNIAFKNDYTDKYC